MGMATISKMIINCDNCTVKDVGCNDCALSFLLSVPSAGSGGATQNEMVNICELPDRTVEAIGLLSSRGMVRPLRFNSA